jgi:hypothetical protein
MITDAKMAYLTYIFWIVLERPWKPTAKIKIPIMSSHITFVDLLLELLNPVKMLFLVHSLLLYHGHFAIVTKDALAGELCISDLADELPFFQPFEEECFLEVPGFVFEFESFCRTGASSSSGNLSSPSNS